MARGARAAPGGAGAAEAARDTQAEHRLFPLTGVRLGLWKPRSAWSAYLLVLPAARKFVVLLTRVDARKVGAAQAPRGQGLGPRRSPWQGAAACAPRRHGSGCVRLRTVAGRRSSSTDRPRSRRAAPPTPRPPQRRGHLGTIKDNVEALLRHKNPFFVEDAGSVMAFEAAWGDVLGMDYQARLMEDARLVLEARHVAKRVFPSVRPRGALPRVRP
jgi:hypothetical protein